MKFRKSKTLKPEYYNPNNFNSVDALLAYVIMLITFALFSFGLPYLVKIVRLTTFVKDYFLLQIILAFISQGLIFLVALIFFKVKKVAPFKGNGYHFNVNSVDLLMSVMLILGVGLCFTSLHYEFFDNMTGIFGDLGLDIDSSIIEKSSPIFILAYTFIITPVLPAICEELLFRGVVMRGLEEKGLVFSVIFSSLLFALMHGSVGMIILQFLLGLAISVVVVITKNHLYGCIMHFSTNFFIGIFSSIPEIVGESVPAFKYIAGAFITIFGITFLLVGVYYFIKKALAKYKNQLLNVKPKRTYVESGNESLVKDGDSVYTKYYDELSIETLGTNLQFFYKKGFTKFNKKGKDKLFIALVPLSVIVAIVSLFI